MYALFVPVFLLFFFVFAQQASAKLLPQTKSSTTIQTAPRTTGGSVTVSPKLRRDRNALIIYFNNLTSATSVSYSLIYTANGRDEGAGGSVRPSEGSATRELLFGTCSAGVCRYHSNISNMKLEVTIVSKSGKTTTKRYRIKV